MATLPRPLPAGFQVDRHCAQTMQPVGRDHRCSACFLQSQLDAERATVLLLRDETARLATELKNARLALFAESEAHGITARRLARFESEPAHECQSCGVVNQQCECAGVEADSNRTLGLSEAA